MPVKARLSRPHPGARALGEVRPAHQQLCSPVSLLLVIFFFPAVIRGSLEVQRMRPRKYVRKNCRELEDESKDISDGSCGIFG